MGMAYIKEGMGELDRKITLEIVKSSSGALCVGAGIME